MKNKLIVISLGGSLIVPDEIDIDFLNKFKKLIDSLTKQKYRFVLICGGGKTCRKYQSAASGVIKIASDDLDWLGIHATRINAHLLRTIFKRDAHPQIITHPLEKIQFKEKLLIAAGWKPGWSTDYDAVILARKLGAEKIINLSNITYAYDKDPNKFPDAKPIIESNWKEFRKILPIKWTPGLNSPFDPIASKLAEKYKLKVVIMNGRDMINLKACITGKKFKGTIIE
jgi:uridylate kinase